MVRCKQTRLRQRPHAEKRQGAVDQVSCRSSEADDEAGTKTIRQGSLNASDAHWPYWNGNGKPNSKARNKWFNKRKHGAQQLIVEIILLKYA